MSDTLIHEYLPLARRMAAWYTRSRRDPDARRDAYSDALLGLMTAARSFDATKGAVFQTFAYRKILWAMKDGSRLRSPWSRRQLRAGPPVVHQLSVDLPRDSAPPSADLDARDELERMLRGLTAEERTVFLGVFVEDRLQADVAAELGCVESLVSIRSREIFNRLSDKAMHLRERGLA